MVMPAMSMHTALPLWRRSTAAYRLYEGQNQEQEGHKSEGRVETVNGPVVIFRLIPSRSRRARSAKLDVY